MRLHAETSKQEISFSLDPNTKQVGVSDFVLRNHLPYSDADSLAISGPESLILTECESREDFMNKLNQSKYINVSLHDERFVLQDTKGLLGAAPVGIYKSNVVDKMISLQKEANGEFTFKQLVDLDGFNSIAKNIQFRGGVKSNTISFSGASTDSKIGQANALLLIANLVQNSNRVPFKKSKTDSIQLIRAKRDNEIVTLQQNGVVVYPVLEEGDFLDLSVIGQNNGLLMQMPTIAWVNEYLVGGHTDVMSLCEAGFTIRAASLFDSKHIEDIAAIPNDIKTFRIKRIAADKYEVFAIKKDAVEVLCFRTVALGANTRLVLANNQVNSKVFMLPDFVQTTTQGSRDGSLVLAFKSPQASTFGILTSPKIDATVTSGTLFVCGINTGLPVAANTDYILTVEKDSDLDVELYNVSSPGTVNFSQTGSSFTHSVAQNGLITFLSGLTLGPWCQSSSLSEIEKAVQIVTTEVNGSPTFANLGPFNAEAKTFASYSATFDANILTVSNVAYTRLPYQLSSQVAAVLRLPRDVTGDMSSLQKSYTKRVEKIHIYCNGLDVEGFNGSNLIGFLDVDEKIQFPVMHNCRGKKIHVHYCVVDSQTHKQRVGARPKNEIWSVTLATI